jgi:hypothetical protein
MKIERVAQPRYGTRTGQAVRVQCQGLTGTPGSLLVDTNQVAAGRWRAKMVRFTVPSLPGGVYPVRLLRGTERSDPGELFVADGEGRSRRASLRAAKAQLGTTTWWRTFDELQRQEPALANPFRLAQVLRSPDDASLVAQVVTSIDTGTYGSSRAERRQTASAFATCARSYLLPIPDSELDGYLRCAGYGGPRERFRSLPADVQIRVLNSTTSGRAGSCFVASPYAEECRQQLKAAGVGPSALATIGFQ